MMFRSRHAGARFLSALVEVVTEILIWLATRTDSTRLGCLALNRLAELCSANGDSDGALTASTKLVALERLE